MAAMIEKDFPIEQLSPIAEMESYRKNIYRPVYHVHKWWAKRLGSVFRMIVLSTLLPDGSDDAWECYTHGHDFRGRIVYDPFMGAGTTLGEALRLGCRVIGQDINPVAWFQVKKALEPVNLEALDRAFDYLSVHVAPQISRFYRTRCPDEHCHSESDILYTFWVKVLACPECGHDVDLFTTRLFSKAVYTAKDPTGYAVCPRCGAVNQVGDVRSRRTSCQECGLEYDPHCGNASSKSFVCPSCGKSHRIIDVVRASGTVPRHRMYAIDYLCPHHGRGYKKPDGDDMALYVEAESMLPTVEECIPTASIPEGYNTKQILNFNYRRWSECFNSRQLYSIATLLDGIRSIPDGLADNNVRECLLILLSACLEFNNMFCSFKGRGTGAVRHMFSHHVLAPEKTPLENNLWGTEQSSGSFRTLYRSKLLRAKSWAKRPVERLVGTRGVEIVEPPLDKPVEARLVDTWHDLQSGEGNALIRCASSRQLEGVPNGSIDAVITDPPYFDNVNYSELADFFYAWLRTALADRYAEFERDTTRHRDEAIVNEAQGKSSGFYQQMISLVLRECHRVLKDEGVLAFTFHHSSPAAWLAMAEAISSAGFRCVAVWPIQGEMSVGVPLQGARDPIQVDTILVCRKEESLSDEPRPEWDACMHSIRTDLSTLLRRLDPTGKRLGRADRLVIAEALWLKHYRPSDDDDPSSRLAQLVDIIDL